MTRFPPEHDLDDTPRSRRHSSVQQHWIFLFVCSLIVIAAFSLEVRDTGRVGTLFGPDFVLPPLCMSQLLFGVNCPGCGMTRSFIYLAQGDWRASWDMHHLGWLFALAVIVQIPYRIYRLCKPGRIRIARGTGLWLGCGVTIVMLVNWLLGFWPAN